MSGKKRKHLSPVARLAAATEAMRPGTASPAATASLLSAPPLTSPAGPSAPGRLRKSLRAVIAEGLFAEVITACAGGAALTAWCIYLGAGPLVTGIVVALPQMAQLFQIPAAWSTALLGHKRASVWFIGACRQVTLPMVALPFLSISSEGKQTVLLVVAALSAILGVLGNNAWVAWMGDLVPERIRGRYFGRRTALCTLGGSIAAATVGVLLDVGKGHDFTGGTLAALQVFACASGALTVWLMLRQHEPVPHVRVPIGLGEMVRPLRDPAMKALIVYQVIWNAAVGVAGSFFALHMLKNLEMDFTWVALHGVGFGVMRILSAPLWGRLIDRVGARAVLVTSSFGIATIPFLWLLPTPDSLWPLVVDAVVAGVLWCGHALAVFSLPLAIMPRAGRPFYFAAFGAAGGVAFSIATVAGGLIAQGVPDTFSVAGRSFANLHVLFFVSGTLRLLASVAALGIVAKNVGRGRTLWEETVSMGKDSFSRARNFGRRS